MSEYLVRWKFGPNSLLNPMDHETAWYLQIHQHKKDADKHYTSLLYGASPAMAMTTEIFELVIPKPPRLAINDEMEALLDIVKQNPGICRLDLQKKSMLTDKQYGYFMQALRHRKLIENRGTRQLPEYYVV